MGEQYTKIKDWFRRTDVLFDAKVEILLPKPKTRGYTPDGIVKFSIGKKKFEVLADLKVTIVPRNLESIVLRKEKYGVKLFAAEYITPQARKKLMELDISYLDSDGNFFFSDENIFILIDRTKGLLSASKKPKAFSKLGLTLIYHFFQDSELMNRAYRVIEDQTNISRNTVNRVISSLNEEGFLDSGGDKKFFTNTVSLLDEWFKYASDYLSKGDPLEDQDEMESFLNKIYKDLKED